MSKENESKEVSLEKINPVDFGIEEKKAEQVKAAFVPMLDKMVELEKEYNAVMQKEISPEVCREAKELRKRYVKIRTGTAEIHKKAKSFYLNGGRFCDALKNTQLATSQGKEESLKERELHYDLLEEKKIQDIQNSRAEQLAEFEVEFIPDDLGKMSDPVWENYITGVESHYKAKKEAEEKEEQDRIENERKEKQFGQRQLELAKYDHLEVEFTLTIDTTDEDYEAILVLCEKVAAEYAEKQREIEAENQRLKEEAEEREKQLQKEREENERLEREEQERKEKEEAERKRLEQEAEEKRIAEEKRLKAEAEEADRLKQAELQKGDTEKFQDFIADLNSLKGKYTFTSEKYSSMYSKALSSIDKMIKEAGQ